MLRFIILAILFLLSLLCIFPAPALYLWLLSILVTEFSWIFIAITVGLLLIVSKKFYLLGNMTGILALVLFLSPIVRAYIISYKINYEFENAFKIAQNNIEHKPAFKLWQMITGINAKTITYKTLGYKTYNDTILTLDFYPSELQGQKPCVIVIHGGSWSGGDSRQLPELNSYLAKAGYNVASINYRLAPAYKSPAPIEDVQAALSYLKKNSSSLKIDTENFVLIGRSAGGQLALSAAYSLHDKDIKSVISFYGPADMVWGYQHPANPLVIHSKKILEDFLGGTYQKVPQKYIASSPIESVTSQSVPTLLIHGKNDPLVAYEHCIRLSERLKEQGVSYFVLTLPWATHGFDFTLNGPGGQLSTHIVERFIKLTTK